MFTLLLVLLQRGGRDEIEQKIKILAITPLIAGTCISSGTKCSVSLCVYLHSVSMRVQV